MNTPHTRKLDLQQTADIVKKTLQETSKGLDNVGHIILKVSKITLMVVAMLNKEAGGVSALLDAPRSRDLQDYLTAQRICEKLNEGACAKTRNTS